MSSQILERGAYCIHLNDIARNHTLYQETWNEADAYLMICTVDDKA